MKRWSAQFQPRSLCSFGDSSGDSNSDSGGPGGGPSGGGDTFGDTGPTGDFSGPESSNVSNADFFGPDTGGPQFSASPDVTSPDVSFPDTSGPSFSDSGSQLNFNSDPGVGPSISGDTFGQFPGDTSGFNMAPTAGVDFTGQGQAFGPNATGPGFYGTDQSGYLGPGPQGAPPPAQSTMSPDELNAMSSHSPGYQPPGDPMGAPNPASVFGSPNIATPNQFGQPTQGIDPAFGPGWAGGPLSVQPGEAFPGGRGEQPAQAMPSDQRGQNFFGPENVGPQFAGSTPANSFFGVGQAQAAGRGTDQGMINQDVLAGVNDAGRVAQQVAQDNPALANALNAWASNQQVGMGQLGPGMPAATQGPSPGAQQGFTGVSPAQSSFQGFTGQPAAFNPDSTQGKGDRGDTASPYQMTNADIVGAVNTAQQAQQQAAQQQAAMFDAQALGDQGRAPAQTANQTVANAFDALQAQNQQMAQQQAAPFDQQALGEQGRAGRPGDDFSSRFGDLPPAQAQPDTFDSRFGDFPAPVTLDPNQMETISRAADELTTGLVGPASRGVGQEAAPLGLGPPGSPGRGGEAAPFGGARSGSPFGETGRTSDTGRPSLSITVGPNQYAPSGRTSSQSGRGDPGYYNTGGRGIAPGALGAEKGGIYGPGVATGRPGTNTFGVSSREGAYGFFGPQPGAVYVDPNTGIAYRR